MKRTMKRALFPLMLALVLLLPACGSGGGNGAPADQTASSTPGAAGGETAEFGGIYEVESPSQSPQESPVYQDPDAKLVRRAELYVETTEFDQAAQQLNEMVNQAGGYFESAAVEGGSYRNVNANRYGSYVIRVPEDAYTGFLQDAGELGYLASKTESTENISTQYYDTEARLKTLRTKQERLLALIPGLAREGGDLTLRHFGEKFAVDATTGAIRSLDRPGPVSATVRLNIYTLFGYVSPLARFRDQWVTFPQLRDTSVFEAAFQSAILRPLAATFSGHAGALRQALEAMGGTPLPTGDVGYQVEAFACIPVRYLFWEGDDEFPAQANMLFDASATDYIHGESIVTIGSYGLSRLAELAGLPLARGTFPSQ